MRPAAAGAHDRHAIEVVMVEQGFEIVRDHGGASAWQPRRNPIARAVRQQVADAELPLDRRGGGPVQPGAPRPRQSGDGGPAALPPPPPRERAAVRELELAVFVADAVLGHGHGRRLRPGEYGGKLLDDQSPGYARRTPGSSLTSAAGPLSATLPFSST